MTCLKFGELWITFVRVMPLFIFGILYRHAYSWVQTHFKFSLPERFNVSLVLLVICQLVSQPFIVEICVKWGSEGRDEYTGNDGNTKHLKYTSRIEPGHSISSEIACAPGQDSDQPL